MEGKASSSPVDIKCLYHSERIIVHKPLLPGHHHLPKGPRGLMLKHSSTPMTCEQAQSHADLMLGSQACHCDAMHWDSALLTPVFPGLTHSYHRIFMDGFQASKRVIKNGWPFNRSFISRFWVVTRLYFYCFPLQNVAFLTEGQAQQSTGVSQTRANSVHLVQQQ